MKFFFQFMIILLVINISFAQTNYYVDNTMGNDMPENGTGTGALAWKTIEYAVNNVSNPTTEQIIINITNGIYDLSNDQIDINRGFYNLTLLGEGSDNTFIQSATDTSSSTSRVLKIYSGNNVTLKGLTIRYGRIIFPDMNGGGILNEGGTLSLDYCKVTENSGGSPGVGYGGGIANLDGSLTINNSSITYNTGADTGQGAGIGSLNGTLNINNSTISYNKTKHSGGGIAVISNGANSIFNMENSTVYGNEANHFGGIRVTVFGPQPSSFDITTNINSCTIFNNYAEDFYGGIGLSSPSSFNIKNSIVAGNTWSVHPDDIRSSYGIQVSINSGGYNIFQSVSDSIIITGEQNNNIGVDPMLLPLADNGTNNGTQTCALLPESPAINAIPGENGAPLMDQRGYTRVGNYDIGAYEYPTFRARVQFVHNSSDISVDTVDVYINGSLAINDFAFRTATPFLDLPASEILNIGFAPANSQSVADTIKNFPIVLTSDEKYVAIANGVLDPNSYASNPDGKSTAFKLFVKDMARETGVGSDVDFFVLHGITNLPAIKIRARELDNAVLVDSLSYGDMTSYINSPAQDLTFDIYTADGISYIKSFRAPFAGLGGQAITLFASGFVNSSLNQNGPEGGLFAAFADGRVIQLSTGLEGDFYVGAPGTGPNGSDPQFASLRDAFQALNNSAFTGNCTFYITSDIDELFPYPAPNGNYGLGLAINPDPYTVTFKPYTGVQPVITLEYPVDQTSGPSGALIIGIPTEGNIAWNDLKVTRNIVIDGSNTVNGTTRDLTIQTALTAHRNAFPLTIVGDVSNMVVKNTNIYYKAQGVSTSGNLFVSAVQLRSRNNLNVDYVPHDILFENNHISANFDGVVQSAQGYGTYQSGTPVPAALPYNITLKNNLIEGKRRAVALYKAGSHNIVGNEIILNQNIAANTTNEAIYAADVDTNSVVNIYNNKISKISSMTNFASAGNTGINVETFGTYNIYNNMIYGFGLTSANPVAYLRGIKNSSATATLNLNYNSIYMNNLADVGTGTVTYQGILLSDGTNNVENNIVISAEKDFPSYSIYRSGTSGTLVSNYNDFYPATDSAKVGYFNTAATPTLLDWQTASTQDANSVSKEVFFVSDTDLHLTGSSNGDFNLAGTPITGITTDIDGNTRSTTYPYMGADEASIKLVPWVTIAEAREDLNADGIPDKLGETLKIHGVVISPNFQTVNHSYYIWDGTAGIAEILFGTTSPALSLGDSVEMVGKIDLYRGLTEFSLSAATDLTILGSGSTLPNPLELTLAQYKASPEMYEGTLLKFNSLNKVTSPAWPGSGASATLKFTDGIDTVDFRIDSDTDIDGSTEPTWPANIVGIGSQFSSSATSYFDGYQILPRYITDFTSVASSVENEKTIVTEFALAQNYPNPFNPSTKINYSVPSESKVTISVYSITGELVAELVNEYKTPGNYSVNFDGSKFASGMYIYRMTAGNFVKTNKMMLLK